MLLGAMLALAVGALLLEVLAYRLSSAALGPVLASFVGLGMPAAAALGAALLTRLDDATDPARIARRGAYVVALGGAGFAFATIGLAWVSQVIAREEGDAAWYHGLIALSGWLLTAFATGGALALVFRLGLPFIGRLGWLESASAAVACLALPLVLSIGAPRAALATGMLYVVASTLLGIVGRRAHPRWSALVTLPLALLALLIGDLGKPWMQVRSDLGLRTRVEYGHWTPEGLIAVDERDRNRVPLAIDRSRKMAMPPRLPESQKPSFAGQDLVYALDDRAGGPALVIGSTGGRDVITALAYDHTTVDAVELHHALVNHILADRYASEASLLFADERVRIAIGDGPEVAARLPRDHYQRVIVLGEARFVHAGPRLVGHHDRLFTERALSIYLERLRAGGSLLVRVRDHALHGLLATAAAAIGNQDEARARTVACTTSSGSAVVVIHSRPLTPREQQILTARCASQRMTSEHPHRTTEPAVNHGAPWNGWVATTDRPFLEAPPPFGDLGTEAWDALRALDPPPWKDEGDESVESSQAGVAVAASVLLVALVALVGWIARRGASSRRQATEAHLSLSLFGLALSLCTFAWIDRLLVASGSTSAAWSLLIPLGLAGLACGRLWMDVPSAAQLRARAPLALGIGALWLALSLLVALSSTDAGPVALMAAALLLVTSAVLGAPLIAWLRFATPARVGAHLGSHQAGWALGGALAMLLTRYAGISWMMPVGLCAYLAGAALLAAHLRRSAA
jgi:spermidine synthase